MQIREIQEYSQVRAQARAYLCYIMGRNISQNIQNGDISTVLEKLDELNGSIESAEAIYALDTNGIQLIPNISKFKIIVFTGFS